MSVRNRNKAVKEAAAEENETMEQTKEEQTPASEVVTSLKDRIEAAERARDEERAKLDEEISRREQELDQLYELRGYGREGQGKRRVAAKRGESGTRINWDEKLAALPKMFTVDDLMKDPEIAAKGRPQIYPALNRWASTQKIKKLERGKYRRLAA